MSANGSGALSGLGAEDLRAAVRAVLQEVLPAEVARGAGVAPAPGGEVVLETEADVRAFVSRIAALCDDPAQREALRSGRHGFRPAPRDPGRRGTPAPVGGRGAAEAVGGVVRVERGAVTERVVVRAAAERARLVVGRRAVLTPLARDKARTLGVEIERER